MEILYPLTLSLSGQKYNAEIISLAIMGQAAMALAGQSQYIQTTTAVYRNYCALTNKQFFPRLLEIINDGGKVLNLEVYILAPTSLLNMVVPEGLRYRLEGKEVRKFKDWNDGAGQNPIFNLPDSRVIMRTNLGGTVLTQAELLIIAAMPGITLLSDLEAQEIIRENTPDFA